MFIHLPNESTIYPFCVDGHWDDGRGCREHPCTHGLLLVHRNFSPVSAQVKTRWGRACVFNVIGDAALRWDGVILHAHQRGSSTSSAPAPAPAFGNGNPFVWFANLVREKRFCPFRVTICSASLKTAQIAPFLRGFPARLCSLQSWRGLGAEFEPAVAPRQKCACVSVSPTPGARQRACPVAKAQTSLRNE